MPKVDQIVERPFDIEQVSVENLNRTAFRALAEQAFEEGTPFTNPDIDIAVQPSKSFGHLVGVPSQSDPGLVDTYWFNNQGQMRKQQARLVDVHEGKLYMQQEGEAQTVSVEARREVFAALLMKTSKTPAWLAEREEE